MRSFLCLIFATFLANTTTAAIAHQEQPGGPPPKLPTITQKTANLEAHNGLLNFFVDHDSGRIWLSVPPPTDSAGTVGEYLYIEGLVSGLGSNPVGLDRGQIGDTKVVRLRRIGRKVMIEAPNQRYRALSDDPAELRAVRHSFATSVLWVGEIGAIDPDGRSLVDLTSFLVRDAHGIEARLKRAGQGSFTLDRDRSLVLPENCIAFPENLEFEVLLTYTGHEPGPHVRSTAPVGEAISLVQHHSLVKLPDPGYSPRRFDPRTASYAMTFMNYAAPLDEPIETRWIVRHRLEKKNPSAALSPAVEPIVYYVDRGAPEPVRSALIEGASWWNEAFNAAGFENAFRVELLPEDAHPLDIRYNMIQWVHRSTRGWSYGGGVRDPRTGEMIKGHVSLGSLRVRQDILLFEGLLGADNTSTGLPDDPIEIALSRIRQLSAHEVGHTLGFSHNYAASTYAGRASVMDYPGPLLRVGPDGRIDASNAYGVGMGAWDIHAIRYAYTQFPPGADEEAELHALIRSGLDNGLIYLSDADAGGPGGAHPLTSQWDNGADPVAELDEVMAVRKVALENFGEANLAPNRPLALLHEVLTPVYFHHRYQAEAAAKSLGGLNYEHAVRGDNQPKAIPVPGADQRRALRGLLATLDPQVLDIPESILELMYPRAFGYSRSREMFNGHTEPTFDALAAAATAADMVVGLILQPQRMARLVDFHRRDADLPGAEEIIAELVDTIFARVDAESPRLAEIRRAEQRVLADRLVELASDDVSPAVRTSVESALRNLTERLDADSEDTTWSSHGETLRRDITRYLEAREWTATPHSPALPIPPGSPIGDSGPWHVEGSFLKF